MDNKPFYTALKCGAIACALTFGTTAAQAAILNLEIIAGTDPETRSTIATFDRDDLGCSGEANDITSTCSGSGASVNWGGGTFDIDSWNMFIDSDPVVSGGVLVTNNTAATQWYTMIFTLPIAPAIGPTSLVGGSIQGGVTDNNGNGATLSAPAGLSIYQAIADFTTTPTLVDTLLDAPFSITVGGFQSNSASEDFGTPIPSNIGPAVNDDITIQLDFLLTANDSASFTSVFVVQPVPVPAAVLFFGSALLGLGALRRRRR